MRLPSSLRPEYTAVALEKQLTWCFCRIASPTERMPGCGIGNSKLSRFLEMVKSAHYVVQGVPPVLGTFSTASVFSRGGVILPAIKICITVDLVLRGSTSSA